MNKQQTQAGSIGVFLLVSVVLAAFMISSIVWVRSRQAPAPNKVAVQQSSEQADTQQQSQQPAPQAANEQEDKAKREKEAAEKEAARVAEEKRASEAKAKEAEEEKRRAEARQAEQRQTEAAQQQAAQGPMARAQAPVAGALPTTGPLEDAVMMTIGALAIAGAGYVYYHYGRKSA